MIDQLVGMPGPLSFVLQLLNVVAPVTQPFKKLLCLVKLKEHSKSPSRCMSDRPFNWSHKHGCKYPTPGAARALTASVGASVSKHTDFGIAAKISPAAKEQARLFEHEDAFTCWQKHTRPDQLFTAFLVAPLTPHWPTQQCRDCLQCRQLTARCDTHSVACSNAL